VIFTGHASLKRNDLWRGVGSRHYIKRIRVLSRPPYNPFKTNRFRVHCSGASGFWPLTGVETGGTSGEFSGVAGGAACSDRRRASALRRLYSAPRGQRVPSALPRYIFHHLSISGTRSRALPGNTRDWSVSRQLDAEASNFRFERIPPGADALNNAGTGLGRRPPS